MIKRIGAGASIRFLIAIDRFKSRRLLLYDDSADSAIGRMVTITSIAPSRSSTRLAARTPMRLSSLTVSRTALMNIRLSRTTRLTCCAAGGVRFSLAMRDSSCLTLSRCSIASRASLICASDERSARERPRVAFAQRGCAQNRTYLIGQLQQPQAVCEARTD